MSKTSMIVAGATGYVLGARAGRERYEQIATQARRFWSNPKVQKASQDAQDLAREKAPIVGEKLAGAAKGAAGAASSAVSRDSDPSGPGSST
ncbi:MAG: YtxH domain-containing protein [Propionibacteriales bacterium]|nr:YtxH domain-containing protein [Propionibacteriales bacterium]